MIDKSLKLIDRTKIRLIYSFFIQDGITSFDEHIAYAVHFKCLEYCFKNWNLFNECIFIIHTKNLNNPLITELKNKLADYTINVQHINFIVEQNDQFSREGIIFKKYVIDKFEEYDGLTLFFHNKGFNTNYNNTINNWCSYWVIGQYFQLMTFEDQYLGGFLNSNKLIYGWPYICDNHYKQWFIAGSCYWMKCKEIKKYIDDNNLHTNHITSKCIAEYYFPEIFDKELIDYPYSNIIKNYLYKDDIVDFTNNENFNEYLKTVTPYNEYLKFIKFHNFIINEISK